MSSENAKLEISGSGRLPSLGPGIITPEVADLLVSACCNYFSAKDIPDDKMVAKTFSCFVDPRIQKWINSDCARSAALSFTDFVTEFKGEYLERDWESKLRCRLQSARMHADKPFSDYFNDVYSMNCLLDGTTSYLSDAEFCMTVEAALVTVPSLQKDSLAIDRAMKLRDWVEEVKELDFKRRESNKRMRDAIEESNCANKRAALSEPSRCYNTQSSSGSGAGSSSRGNNQRGGKDRDKGSSSNPSNEKRCPALTSAERDLLYAHAGCLKCRTFHAGHVSADRKCNFPDPNSYRVRC